MDKILIISNRLSIGGAEKLLYELIRFAQANKIEPEVLILDNYATEYYDDILKQMNVKVTRSRIKNITHFRAPVKMLRSVIWSLKLKFFADKFYNSIHTLGLYNADKVLDTVVHKKRFFWHVNNSVQFVDGGYPYQREVFGDEKNTIVCINSYQITEIQQQYGTDYIKAKLSLFKLFIA